MKAKRNSLLLALSLLWAGVAYSAPDLSVSTDFLPADGVRTYLDIGGAWNGTTDVTATTGDTFEFRINNGASPATSAFDLAPSITLPVGYNYVAGTANVALFGAGCGAPPSISGSQVGTTLTFNLSGYDLPASCDIRIRYGIVTSTTILNGTYTVTPTYRFALVNGGALSGPVTTNTSSIVRPGATILYISPNSQTRAVGTTASWSVNVCNTGLGGLFGVTIDESAINPNPAGSLQITGITQTSPGAPAATGSIPTLTLPYLAPATCFVATVNASVLSCTDITNTASTTDRTTATAKSLSASVQIDLLTPLIDYTPGAVTMNYDTAKTVTIPVSNMGLGQASLLKLATNLNSLPVTVSNVSGGWSYAGGTFTYGTLANGASAPLTFDVQPNNVCTYSDARVFWFPTYRDGCGNPFSVPSRFNTFGAASTTPGLSVESTGPSRVAINEIGQWKLSVSAANKSFIATDPIVVTDVLSSVPAAINVGAPSAGSVSCGGPCGPGKTLSWTIPLAALTGKLDLPINFTAPSDPCAGGAVMTNGGTVSATSTSGCAISGGASTTTLITNSLLSAFSQSFNVQGTGPYETGAADDGDASREPGEGQFIGWKASYSFGPGSAGTWTTATYTDDYSGLPTQALVKGTLFADVNGTGPVAVPAPNILQSTGKLRLDLSFVTGLAGSANVGGTDLVLTYSTTVGDSDLQPAGTRSTTQLSSLVINGGTGICSGSSAYVQGDFLSLARSVGTISLSGASTIDVCEEVPVTAKAGTSTPFGIWNSLITFLTSGAYLYPTPQTPVDGGFYNGTNLTYAENAGTNPTFTLGAVPIQQTSDGTEKFNIQLKAGSSTTPQSATTKLDYDDTEQGLSLPRAFSLNGSYAPVLVRQGALSVTGTPDKVTVIADTASWSLYVVNGGAGQAFNVTVQDTIPAGLTPNKAATDLLNAFPSSVAGQDISWSLGTIAPGATVKLGIVADSDETTCSIPDASNKIVTRWGCGGVDHENIVSKVPNFNFLTGQLLIQHETSTSLVSLCDAGSIGTAVLIARNVGPTRLYDVVVNEVLDTAVTGIALGGTYEFSTNGGASWSPAAAPTGLGTPGSPYQWTKVQIPALAELTSQSEGTGVSEVRIRVNLSANETTNVGTPVITASGNGRLGCGNAVTSPGNAYSITVRKPNITVSQLGKNVTQAGSFGSVVSASPGDVVQWQFTINNAGAADAQNVLFTDDIPNSPAAPTGVLNGPGHVNTPVTDNVAIALPNIAKSSGVVYTVDQTIGASCTTDPDVQTVTWGCDGIVPHLSAPTNNTASASLQTQPDFSGNGFVQAFNSLNGGRGEIVLTLNNAGAPATNLLLTDTLLAGFVVDTSYTPTVTSNGSVTAVALGGTSTVPTLTLTGTLENSKNAVVRFRIKQSGNFDATASAFTHPETVANTFDPALPSSGNNSVQLDWLGNCGTAGNRTINQTIDPLTPDLDLSVNPNKRIVQAASAANYDFTIVNNGDAGSVAEGITFNLVNGAGFTINSYTVLTPGTGGTGGACVVTCTAAQIGTLASGASAVIRVNATANNNGSVLQLLGTVTSQLLNNDGSGTGNNLSFDRAQPIVLGFSVSKTLISTSEAFTAVANDLAIGEEVTFRLNATWFGIDPAGTDNITSITFRDVLPTGLGYVSHANTGSNTVAYTISGNTPVTAGTINFAVTDIAPPSTGGVLEVDLVARALNIGGNANGTTRTNTAGTSFVYQSQTFASNNGTLGFGGSETTLAATQAVTIRRPNLTFVKNVRNVTTATAFATNVAAKSGDVLEYRIVVTNTGGTAAFDLSVVDTPPNAKLLIIDGATDGIDNDGDGSTDGADVGGEGTYVAGAGGSVTYNDANTTRVAGTSFGQLNAAGTMTILYRATVDSSINPTEVLSNGAGITYSTLPGTNGSQTAPTGAPNSTTGENVATGNSTATATASNVVQLKTLVTTAVGADTATEVLIGEQVRFRIAVELPAGTAPSLRIDDLLPAGLSLVSTPAVQFGSAISGCLTPTITPGVLPASGAPLAVRWDFGSCLVTVDTTPNRTITVEYIAQVRNIAGNTNGATLANSATSTFGATTSSPSAVTLTVRKPSFTVVKTPSALVGFDAGDVVTYDVTISNTGTAKGYDLSIVDTLPAHLTYVAGSTVTLAGGPIAEPDVAGQVVTWGRTQTAPQTLDVANGSTLRFTYQARVTDGVLPAETLQNSIVVDATSLPGSPGVNLGVAVGTPGTADGEQTGSGVAPNVLRATTTSSITSTNVYSGVKVKSGDTLAPGFRVGDLVTYTITATVQEGTAKNFKIQDTLPAGLAFDSFDAITPATGAGGFTYSTPTGPTGGATGAIEWDLGDLVSTGDNSVLNQQLVLVYRARVLNTGGIATTPTTQSLSNSARLSYSNAAAGTVTTTPSVSAVSVKQPSLGIVKALRAGQPVIVTAGSTVQYRLTVTNSGDAPAYNILVTDTLPSGMRVGTPTTVAATLNGGAVTLIPTYTALTGALQYTLADGEVLNPGQTLVIDFDAVVDGDVGAGRTLTNGSRIDSFASQPSASPTERRTYATVTSNNVDVTTPVPNTMGKTTGSATGRIGQTVTFTLRIPQVLVNAALYDVHIVDNLPTGLKIGSISHNGGTLGVGVTNVSTGVSADLTYASIPANQQAVITIDAIVENIPGNAAGAIRSNQASYTWASTPGGPTQPPIDSPVVTTTVVEPVVAIQKTFVSQTVANPLLGPGAGDSFTYKIRVTNTGTAPAYDLVIDDIADDRLISPTVSAGPDAPGVPANAGSAGGFTTWRWLVAGPLIALTGQYEFQVTFTLGPTVGPYQNLSNSGALSATSEPGVNSDERTYTANAPAVVRPTGSATLAKSIVGPLAAYAVGQTLTYQLEFSFITGSIETLHILDTLPAGLVYVSSSVSTTNAQKQGGGAVTILSAPTTGTLGALDFSFGDIVSTGAGPKVTLLVVVRVRDIPGNVSGTTLTNAGQATIEYPPGTTNTINSTSNPTITVREPLPLLALDAPAALNLGSSSDFTARLGNAGLVPLFQPHVQIQLPAGMRQTDPTTLTMTLQISGGRTLTLTGADYTKSYNPTTGDLQIDLISAAGYIDTTETLTIGFKAAPDLNTPPNTAFNLVGTVIRYGSRDSSAGLTTDTRVVTPTFSTGTVGTANGATGDDPNDDTSVNTQSPQIVFRKTVDKTTAIPGDVLHYTVTLQNTGNLAITGGNLVDNIDTSIASNSLTNVVVAPVTGALVTNGTGGTNGTGVITLTGFNLGVGATLTLSFDVTLKPVLPSGTVIRNQASAVIPGFSYTHVTDSTNPADDNATEEGNDGGSVTDDDPTLTRITSQSKVEVLKTQAFSNGTPLKAGHKVTYTIVIRNNGNENLIASKLQDSIPANTTYVAGTTTLNGVGVPDVGGTSPLVLGMVVQTLGSPAGRIDVGSTATVTLQVEVIPTAVSGSQVINQAVLNGEGQGSGPIPPVLSDDPTTPAAGDPNVAVIDGGPAIRAVKVVSDNNGAPLLAGETITWTVSVRNVGTVEAKNVVLTDKIPTNTTYAPGTLKVDADGIGPLVDVLQTDAADADKGEVVGGVVTVRFGTIAAGAEAYVIFQTTVGGAVAAGTILSNQGRVTGEGFPDEPTDWDNNPTNGHQPTEIVVGAGPALRLQKTYSDLNGGLVVPGERIRYTLVLRNVGTVGATNVTVTDSVPTAHTTYVAGSTYRNGVLVPDVGADSALVAGINLGAVAAGATVTVVFDVTILPSTPDATIIQNQASYTADGPLSGISDSSLEDNVETGNDGSDPNDDDPTRYRVGVPAGKASLSGKVWVDTNGDRVSQPDEPVRAGWIIELLLGDTVVATTRTGTDGTYLFQGLQPGDGYQLRFRHPETHTTYGGPVTQYPGARIERGMIRGLRLVEGLTILDQNLPIDPSGVFYNSLTRAPMVGIVADLTGPAGFDPSLHLLPGQHNQTTGSDGLYRFDLVPGAPAGTYHITFTSPGGFIPGKSNLIPPQATVLNVIGQPDPHKVQNQNVPPTGAQATTYFLDIFLDPNAGLLQPNIINNHIPLDPVLEGAITAKKTTPSTRASIGSLIPYVVSFKNNLSATIPNIDLVDQIPAGFKYVAGSATLNGVPMEPVRVNRTLTWPNMTFTAAEEKVFGLILIVGSGVSEGIYNNEAWAVNNTVNMAVSNRAIASVRISADPDFDCSHVLGRVFDDKNRNGYQDKGERGLAGVRVVSARGWLITTDAEGRYHIACPEVPNPLIGTQYVLKVDERTLPSGYRLTTDNPGMTILTRGKFSRINFGAAIHRVIRLEVKDEAFVGDSEKLAPQWDSKLAQVIEIAKDQYSVVRLAYWKTGIAKSLAERRLAAIREELERRWKELPGDYPLRVEEEVSIENGQEEMR